MEKKPKKDDFEPIYDVETIVSSTDFTGMMPAGVNGEEAAAYAAMFAMRPIALDTEQKEEDKRKE